MIDLTPFEKALNTLDEIILRYEKEKHDNAIRDAVIQRFEYTYSLSIKMLTRFLQSQAIDLPDTLTFNETIRKANQMGLLLSDLEKWTDYRQKRNLTSHTHEETIANSVIGVVYDFQKDAKYRFYKKNHSPIFARRQNLSLWLKNKRNIQKIFRYRYCT